MEDYYLSDLLSGTLSEKASEQDGNIVPQFLKKVTESEVTLKELDVLYTRALSMALTLEALELK